MKRPRENVVSYYVVEKIVNSRMIRGHLEYLVKWMGWNSAHSTWEPVSNLAYSLRQVFKYQREKMLRDSRLSSLQPYHLSRPFSVAQINLEHSTHKSSLKPNNLESDSANRNHSGSKQGVSKSSKGGEQNNQAQLLSCQGQQNLQVAPRKGARKVRQKKNRVSQARSDGGTIPLKRKNMTDSLANKLNGILESIEEKPIPVQPQVSNQKGLQQLAYPQLRNNKGIAIMLEVGKNVRCSKSPKKANSSSNLNPIPVSMEYKGLQGLSCTYIVHFSDGSSKLVDSIKIKQDYLPLYIHFLQNTKFKSSGNSAAEPSTSNAN